MIANLIGFNYQAKGTWRRAQGKTFLFLTLSLEP
jgi:hypothetical protein